MATTPKQVITLDGSGEATVLNELSFAGFLTEILLNKDGQTANPVVTMTEAGSLGRTLLSVTQSASGDSTYTVREEQVTSTNVATTTYANYFIESQIQIAITGGDAAGTVTVQFQYIPIQG